MIREPYEGDIAFKSLAIVGYAIGVAFLRMILFNALPHISSPDFWENVYWFWAGAIFVGMLRKIDDF